MLLPGMTANSPLSAQAIGAGIPSVQNRARIHPVTALRAMIWTTTTGAGDIQIRVMSHRNAVCVKQCQSLNRPEMICAHWSKVSEVIAPGQNASR